MTELELKQLLSKITRPDETARTAAHAHWASLAKPLGGQSWRFPAGPCWCSAPTTAWWRRA